jgi:glycosyltransferase involved in cell wall biosynthesis
MEATSVGLPIVASAIGGVPQVLDDQVDALLVPPGDALLLADAMERMASDQQLRQRLGSQARLKSSSFDISAANRVVADIYLQVADGH